jgi:hypothetical protein
VPTIRPNECSLSEAVCPSRVAPLPLYRSLALAPLADPSRTAALDPVIAAGTTPATVAELDDALRIAAIAHGEWTRIHPFANGNGRIARHWANWVAARYGLPLFVRLRPRPAASLYAGAAALSMRGNHTPMVAVFHEMLRSYVSEN